jgi:hypothetical protein
MPLGLRLRFLLVCLLLRAAQAVAGTFRSQQTGVGLTTRYRVGKASTVFGFDGPFDYETLTEVPADERYRGPIAAAKALVVAAMRIPLASDARWSSVAALDGLYTWLGRPEIAAHARDGVLDDDTFLRLRRCGPHAHWVRRDGEGWIVDYRDLLTDLPVRPGRRLEPCALRWDARGPRLWLDGAWIGPGDAGWDTGKRLFHLAEIHVHELVSHLLWTHLHAEAVAVLVTEHLDRGHPVRELLAPHFAFSLQANQNSGGVLLGARGIFERVFSSGWAGAAELLARGDRAWRFERMVPRRDLAERGADALDAYPWREDAVALWDAVEAHVRRRLPPAPDAEARAWLEALHARYGDRGWPAPDDPDAYVESVSACLFLTVRHTLVNAQQFPMLGYPPVWPATMPAGADTALDQLPTVGETLETVRATFAFSIQYNALASASGDARFASDLAALGGRVSARDSERVLPYRVGHPDRVSGSINA